MSSLMVALGIDRLSSAERAQLVDELLESLDVERERAPLTDEQCKELDRRLDLLEKKATTLSPWAEVEARVLTQLRP